MIPYHTNVGSHARVNFGGDSTAPVRGGQNSRRELNSKNRVNEHKVLPMTENASLGIRTAERVGSDVVRGKNR